MSSHCSLGWSQNELADRMRLWQTARAPYKVPSVVKTVHPARVRCPCQPATLPCTCNDVYLSHERTVDSRSVQSVQCLLDLEAHTQRKRTQEIVDFSWDPRKSACPLRQKQVDVTRRATRRGQWRRRRQRWCGWRAVEQHEGRRPLAQDATPLSQASPHRTARR